MGNMEKFKEIIREMIKFFAELTELEKTKLQAIVDNNIKSLEECMSKEQVAIMQLRVLEKHRAEIQKDLGVEKLSFREIIDNLEGEVKDEILELYQKLADELTLFNHTADRTKTAIEANLYSIDAILERLRQKNNHTEGQEKNFSAKRV